MLRSRAWCIGTACLLSLFLSLVAREPCTIIVNSGDSIQEAIHGAPEGSVVCLVAGKWEESITIGKSLTLVGSGSDVTVLRGSETGQPVIRIESDAEIEVLVDRLTVADAEGTVPHEAHGIRVRGRARLTLTDSAVVGNEWCGIAIWDYAQVAVTGSAVERNWFGIVIEDYGQAVITGSALVGNERHGIAVGDSGQVTIDSSTIARNGEAGIAIRGFAGATIRGSTVERNWSGIRIMDSGSVAITGSIVIGNGWDGIAVSGSPRVELVGNRITANGRYGVTLLAWPCELVLEVTQGHVTGRANAIPGPGEPNANLLGSVCPDALRFLTSEEGGEFDQRE